MTITVLVCAYNSDRYLAAAVESVLAQTHRDFEFILVDDGSADRTLEIARMYEQRDNRVKVITHPNQGAPRSANEAMQVATGEWIARLDADDEMLPHRLERQVAFLRENPDIAVASSLVDYIDEKGRVIGRNTSKFTTRQGVAEAVRHHLPVGFHHPAVIMRKDVVLGLGGYRPEFWPSDDMDLWNRIVDAGHTVLVQPEALTRYRIHSESVTVSRFRVSEQKARWAEACILARHNKLPEPTLQQYLEQRRSLPWPRRFNERRREIARSFYKVAVHHFSRKKYLRFLPRLAVAAVLEPMYVLPRVLPQVRRH